MGKFISGAIGAAKSLKPAEIKQNPARAAGTVVGAAVTAAGHPWAAIAAGSATEKLVDRAIPAIKTRAEHFTDSRGRSTS